jgi:transposase
LLTLKQKWADLFGADFEVLLYDLTSKYFEGEMEQNPKARRGYSRDGRPDCVQLVIALVVTPDGFPLAYEVMDGNTADCSTLRDFLTKIETAYGKARRVWVMDRGIPSEAVLQEMRDPERQTLSGRHSQRTHLSTREEMARSSVAEGARLGGSEALPT